LALDCRRKRLEVFDPEGLGIGSYSKVGILDVWILDIIFNALYLLASLEVFGGAIWLFTARIQRNIRSSVSLLPLLH